MSLAERLKEEGMEKGLERGLLQGLEKGRLQGEIANSKKSIRYILFNRFEIENVEVNKKLDGLDDLIILDNLFNKAINVKSLDEFKKILDNIVK